MTILDKKPWDEVWVVMACEGQMEGEQPFDAKHAITIIELYEAFKQRLDRELEL